MSTSESGRSRSQWVSSPHTSFGAPVLLLALIMLCREGVRVEMFRSMAQRYTEEWVRINGTDKSLLASLDGVVLPAGVISPFDLRNCVRESSSFGRGGA